VQKSFIFWDRFLLVERGWLARYGVALGLAVASLAAAQMLYTAELHDAGSLAIVTVVLSAIYGGLGPALLDGLVTAVGLEYLTEPAFTLLDSWDSAIRLLLHGAIAFLIADLISSLRLAYRHLRNQHMETELAKRARENVLSIVSHDLRTPLSVIKVTVNTLRRAGPNGARLADPSLLAPVERAVDQMQRIIDDMLDAVRIEKGQFRVQLAQHELVPIINDAVMSVRALAEARGVNVALQCQAAQIECDRSRLLQVLGNLLHNAVKFSSNGGRVEIDAALDAHDGVQISVKDYGRGMDEQLMAGLFRRHWQAADTAHSGTGLGLFIAKSIVEAHRGRIEVQSAPGVGATFTVYLPRQRISDALASRVLPQ
jgi:signal transduction histidine kinase